MLFLNTFWEGQVNQIDPVRQKKNVKGQGESYQGLPMKVACKTYSYYIKRNWMRGNRSKKN